MFFIKLLSAVKKLFVPNSWGLFWYSKLQLVKIKKKIKELDSSGHPIVGEASRGCLKGWSNGLQRDVTWGHTLTHYLIYLARPCCNLLPTDLARELFHRVCVANVDRSGAKPLVRGGGSSTHSPTVDADVTVECRSGVETLKQTKFVFEIQKQLHFGKSLRTY